MSNENYAIFASYGNDSIALIQWMHEHEKSGIVVYSDTGWASPCWTARVESAEAWAQSLGFDTARTHSEGMLSLARRKKGWPPNGRQYCTQELKIIPAQTWLDEHDPAKEMVCCAGIRRAESRARAFWPEWVEESDKHGGRSAWFPLVRHTNHDLDRLLAKTPFPTLPHRSWECYPCVPNANKADIASLSPQRIDELEQYEREMGFTSQGKPRTIVRPARAGGAIGIREVWEWATGRNPNDMSKQLSLGYGGGCDSGFCEITPRMEGEG